MTPCVRDLLLDVRGSMCVMKRHRVCGEASWRLCVCVCVCVCVYVCVHVCACVERGTLVQALCLTKARQCESAFAVRYSRVA